MSGGAQHSEPGYPAAAVLADMVSTFEARGLQSPPVPPQLARSLEYVDPWFWTTATVDPMDLYMFGLGMYWALDPDTPDHFAVTHRGHGVNSYGLAMSMRLGPAVLVVQHGWGGAYTDNDAAASSINDWHQDLSRFLASDVARNLPVTVTPAQYLLAFSDFRAQAEVLMKPDTPTDLMILYGAPGWLPIQASEHAPDSLPGALSNLLDGLTSRLEQRRKTPRALR